MNPRLGHSMKVEHFVQLLDSQKLLFQNQLSYRFAGLEIFFRNFRTGKVSYVRIQNGDNTRAILCV
jgi:hypothetical protein